VNLGLDVLVLVGEVFLDGSTNLLEQFSKLCVSFSFSGWSSLLGSRLILSLLQLWARFFADGLEADLEVVGLTALGHTLGACLGGRLSIDDGKESQQASNENDNLLNHCFGSRP